MIFKAVLTVALILFTGIIYAQDVSLWQLLAADVPKTVTDGGAASINWVLAISAPFFLMTTVYAVLLAFRLLKERAQENANVILLLKDATDVLFEIKRTNKELIPLLEKLQNLLSVESPVIDEIRALLQRGHKL